MPPPSTNLRYLRRAFRQGRFDSVCTLGDASGEASVHDPDRAAELAEIALLVGAAHAAQNRLTIAEEYLAHGLDRIAALPDDGRDRALGIVAAAPAGATEPRPPLTDAQVPVAPPQAPPAEEEPADEPAPPAAPAIVTSVPGWPPTEPGAPGPLPPPPVYPAYPGAWVRPAPPPPPDPGEGWPASAPSPPVPPWPNPPWDEAPWSLNRTWGAPGGRPAASPWSGSSFLAPPPPPRREPFVQWCALLLCQLNVRTGHAAGLRDRLSALAEPHHDPPTRFAAARGQAALATLAGDHERAHHLLNTAAGLAARVPSRFRATLVERDRAVVLARERRLREALNLGERVLQPLIRPVTGDYQRWSRLEGTSLALELSRHAALAGDGIAAERLLEVATDALAPLGQDVLGAHLLLTTAVVRGAAGGGDTGEAEEMLGHAGALFEHSGDRSAGALVLLEHARIAHRRGLDRSAHPLYQQAAAELRACGHRHDAREPEALLVALDAGEPPPYHTTR